MVFDKIYQNVVIGADVGGTNITLTVVSLEQGLPQIVLSRREKTSSISDISDFVNDFLEYARDQEYGPVEGCFAVAGRVEDVDDSQRVEMTNTNLIVDSEDIKARTGLENVLIINDFEAISYATNVLSRDDFITLNKGRSQESEVRAVIGAGTGLGKSILHFDSSLGAYVPLPSEGGHADLPLLNDEEIRLSNFIKEKKSSRYQLCYEDVLSGRGLVRIYQYLNQTKFSGKPAWPDFRSAEAISQSIETNLCSKQSFQWFIRFYARCARNFILDSLATSGLYIAGGIAAKNSDAFLDFMDEFVRNETYNSVLQDIPVYLITNYDISPIGSAYALVLQRLSGSWRS